jgi:hypothetical protein
VSSRRLSQFASGQQVAGGGIVVIARGQQCAIGSVDATRKQSSEWAGPKYKQATFASSTKLPLRVHFVTVPFSGCMVTVI